MHIFTINEKRNVDMTMSIIFDVMINDKPDGD
jgi:hypothetical protein